MNDMIVLARDKVILIRGASGGLPRYYLQNFL